MVKFFFSFVSLLVFCILTGVPLMAVGTVYGLVWAHLAAPLALALAPVFAVGFIALMLCFAWALRACIPPLEPGEYPFPAHRQALLWALHFLVQRVLYLSVWRELCFGNHFLRWLMLRALGCATRLDLETASTALLLDPRLLRHGAGFMIAADAMVVCHHVKRGRLRLGRIVLGDRVEVLSNAVVGPGTEIGDGTSVGFGARIVGGSRIGREVAIGIDCLIHGKVTLGDGVSVGDQAVIEAGATVEAGATIAPRAVVPRGATVPAGSHFPNAENELDERSGAAG